jgi:uncharacterized protein (TIGR00369 family)
MNTPPAAAPRSAEDQARFERGVIESFERRIPFNAVLGIKVLSLKTGDVRLRFDMKPELVGAYNVGRLHGGAICTALDAFSGMALLLGIAERHPGDTPLQLLQRTARMGTIDLRVDFLRQGLGEYFVATGEVLRLGGRVGSVHSRLHNDQGELIATATASFIVS